ncbi:MAG: Amuc_1100 family pilus-like protein [Verrucomicrobiales bacterium]|nr:Amuc_1100 family pilus-like protein [Verrucomicrobiales bacterium]
MKGNQFYIVFGVIAVVLLGAAGFYCYKGFDTYKAAGGEFETRRTALLRLKRSEPYPNEENLNAITKEVTEYEGEIKGLFKILDRFQQPLNTTVNDTQFPQILKSKIEAFKALAKEKGIKINEEDKFYMAMDAYRTTLPDPKAVPLLDYELGAIEYLLNILAEAGITQLIDLDRELLPIEMPANGNNAAAPLEGSAVAAKYPVSLTFETKHPAFEKLINQITNDDKYFFILRALRVDNSEKEGLLKGGGDNGDAGPSYTNAAGDKAPMDLVSQIPRDLEVPAQISWMREKGYELQSSDARILLGNESLRVFMVVDLVRFADAAGKGVKGGAKGKKKAGAKGRGKGRGAKN